MSDLRQIVIRGLLWTASANAVAQALSWVLTLFTVRLLTPQDYGLLAMAGVYVGLVEGVNELGLGAALIQKRDLLLSEIEATWTAALIFSAFLTTATVIFAPLIARFFAEPRLIAVLLALSASFLMGATRVVHQSLMVREMRFREIAQIDALVRVTTSLVAFGAALAGLGPWALVTSILVGNFLYAVLYYLHHPSRPGRLTNLRLALSVFRFGVKVMGTRFAHILVGRLDALIVGKLVGADLLGAYSSAQNLASVPMDKFLSVLNQVLFPVFSRTQNDTTTLRRYFLVSLELTLVVLLPCYALLGVTAPYAIPLVLGRQWQAAIRPLQVFALVALFEVVRRAAGTVAVSIGRPSLPLSYSVALLCLMPLPLLVLGRALGLSGILLAWALLYPVLALTFFVQVAAGLAIPPLRLLVALRAPTLSVLVLLGAATAVGRLAALGQHATLIAMILAGGAAYVASIALLDRGKIMELLGYLRHRKSQASTRQAKTDHGQLS